MKQLEKQIKSIIVCIFLAVWVGITGCTTGKPSPEFLAGWIREFDRQPDEAIVKDYESYIRQLPAKERALADVDAWLKDGTGQHAVKIRTSPNGKVWEHILIYNKDNQRIKVIKYANGHVAC